MDGLYFLSLKEPYFLKSTILWANVTTYKITASKATIIGTETQVAQLVNNLPANAGDIRDVGLIPGSGRSPGVGNGNPFQYLCQENPGTEEPGRLQSIVSRIAGHNLYIVNMNNFNIFQKKLKFICNKFCFLKLNNYIETLNVFHFRNPYPTRCTK